MSTVANVLTPIKVCEGEMHVFADGLKEWQLQLLPFMKRFISVMAMGFFLFSIYYLHGVSEFIRDDGDDRKVEERQQTIPDTLRITFILEKEVLDRRYHHRGALLMARVGTTQLTFMTGMVMAFMGTMLILGKMSESVSQVSGGSSTWHVGIVSASPGIILSFFGTVLIVTSLMNSLKITLPDTPVYFPKVQVVSDKPQPSPPPSGQSVEKSSPGSRQLTDQASALSNLAYE